jgi:hypothetical protein
MIKNPFISILIGVLAGSLTAPALGMDSIVGKSASSLISADHRQAWSILQLPPVPYLESMRWLGSNTMLKGPKIDILWRPRPDWAVVSSVSPAQQSTGDYRWASRPEEFYSTR